MRLVSYYTCLLFVTVVSFLAAGCSSGPPAEIKNSRILDSSLVRGGDGLNEITFVRDNLMLGGGLRYRLFLDGHPFADLKTGEEIRIFIRPGVHHFSVLRQPIYFGDKTPREMTAEIVPMRRYVFRVTNDQLGETIIPFNYYLTENPIARLTVSQTLALVKIGSSPEEVLAVVGRPNTTSFKITADGRTEIWAYSYGTLVERIEGGGTAFGYGFSQQINHAPDRTIYFLFANGMLAEIDGN